MVSWLYERFILLSLSQVRMMCRGSHHMGSGATLWNTVRRHMIAFCLYLHFFAASQTLHMCTSGDYETSLGLLSDPQCSCELFVSLISTWLWLIALFVSAFPNLKKKNKKKLTRFYFPSGRCNMPLWLITAEKTYNETNHWADSRNSKCPYSLTVTSLKTCCEMLRCSLFSMKNCDTEYIHKCQKSF